MSFARDGKESKKREKETKRKSRQTERNDSSLRSQFKEERVRVKLIQEFKSCQALLKNNVRFCAFIQLLLNLSHTKHCLA